jgi:hypothetical protein
VANDDPFYARYFKAAIISWFHLVRDKATWNNDALSGRTLQKPEPDKVILCVFLLDNLEDTMNAVYLRASQWQPN